jgi:hypothetical protein
MVWRLGRTSAGVDNAEACDHCSGDRRHMHEPDGGKGDYSIAWRTGKLVRGWCGTPQDNVISCETHISDRCISAIRRSRGNEGKAKPWGTLLRT